MSCFKHQTSEENPLILQQQQQQALLNSRQAMQFNPGQFMGQNQQISLNNRANNNNFNNNSQYQNSEKISNEVYYNQNTNPGISAPNNNNPRMVNEKFLIFY